MTGDAYWLSVEVPAERSAEVMELLKKSGKVTLGEKRGQSYAAYVYARSC